MACKVCKTISVSSNECLMCASATLVELMSLLSSNDLDVRDTSVVNSIRCTNFGQQFTMCVPTLVPTFDTRCLSLLFAIKETYVSLVTTIFEEIIIIPVNCNVFVVLLRTLLYIIGHCEWCLLRSFYVYLLRLTLVSFSALSLFSLF